MFFFFKQKTAYEMRISDWSSDVCSSDLQEVGEDYFGLGLSGRIVAPLGGGVFGHLTGAAGGFYRDTDLTSVERNLCNFCPASDRDFIIAIDDSDDGFGFHGEVGSALELRLSPAVSLFVGGSADYWSSVGAIFKDRK